MTVKSDEVAKVEIKRVSAASRTAFTKMMRMPGIEVRVESRGLDGRERGRRFLRRVAKFRTRLRENALFAQPEHDAEDGTHQKSEEREQQDDSEKLAEEIDEAGNRFRQKIVECAIFEILREKIRGGENGQQRGKDRHRSQADILEHLKFLLKGKTRHEDRATDRTNGENEDDVKDLLADELGKGVPGDDRHLEAHHRP